MQRAGKWVKEMLTTREAATTLGVSTKTVYRMERDGLLVSTRTRGGQRRFARHTVSDYLDRSSEITAPQNPCKYLRGRPPEVKEERLLFGETGGHQGLNQFHRLARLEQILNLPSASHHAKLYGETQFRPKQWLEEWDFKASKTKIYTHGFHAYPAMFIPQVARKLILAFSNEGDTVCDIFCGSGTTLVESCLLGRNSIGIELNPLAVLIARAKTTPISPQSLSTALKRIADDYQNCSSATPPDFDNLHFWFNEKVIDELSRILHAIKLISEENIRNFFLGCFSEVVRTVSFTRNDEFKLVRSQEKLSGRFQPDVWGEFVKASESSIIGMREFARDFQPSVSARVLLGDATKDNGIPPSSVDFLVTSPPYGDSRTTVAYGQFSRLSSQWLGLLPHGVRDLDRELMGGKNNVSLDDPIQARSNTLKFSIRAVAEEDMERAKTVLSFYKDLESALMQAHRALKPSKYFCMIVGNRTVKGLVLKTDVIITELAEKLGFVPRGILYRNIPNKRMPLRNSPTNETGKIGNTMKTETIVLLEKCRAQG